MAKLTFQQKLDGLAKAKPVVHTLASSHIRTLSKRGVVHPASVSPKGVRELCDAIVARNVQDDAAAKATTTTSGRSVSA